MSEHICHTTYHDNAATSLHCEPGRARLVRAHPADSADTAGGAAKLLAVAEKRDLKIWVLEALGELGGSGSVVTVCEAVWQRHETDLRAAGSLFFTWQYDIRWAAKVLRDEGSLKSVAGNRTGPWELAG